MPRPNPYLHLFPFCYTIPHLTPTCLTHEISKWLSTLYPHCTAYTVYQRLLVSQFEKIEKSIERPDQGHLYPLGEPRDTCHSRGANLRPPAPQASALPKELSRQLIAGYSELLLKASGRPPQENIKHYEAAGVECRSCVPSEGECAGGPSEVLLLGDPGGVAENSLSFGFTFCSN